MCGIAGLFSLDGRPRPLVESASAMAGAMRHRGPDDNGAMLGWLDDRASCPIRLDGEEGAPEEDTPVHVCLAHRRLAIIDRSDCGHQPMASADGRWWIVYNGEIYNFRELAGELRAEGVELRGHSDTEVLVNGWALWEDRLLRRLHGMFAFAIWDDLEKRLVLARDRIGIKPLYYTTVDGVFMFASDVKTLIASGRYRPAVDLEGLYHSLGFGVAPRPLTSFRGVRGFEQAHWAVVEAGRGMGSPRRYWSVPFGTRDSKMGADEAVEQVDDVVRRAVSRRLVADVPIGTFMSGGVDSSLVSAMAAQESPGILAFTLGFESGVERRDELPAARRTAARHGMHHVTEIVSAERVLEDVDEMVRCYEEPNISLSPNYLISRLVSQYPVTVVLNGVGGDELFSGYNHSSVARFWPLARAFAPLIRRLPGDSARVATLRALAYARSMHDVHTRLFQKMDDAGKRRIFRDGAVGDFDTVRRIRELYFGDAEPSDVHEAVLYLDLMNYVGNHHVYRTDQFTMRFSLEGRFPLLDHELVELSLRIPPRFKIRHGQRKWVLRKVAERYVDPDILKAPKQGFGLPMARWMRTRLEPLVMTSLARLKERGLFVPEEMDRLVERFRDGRDPYTYVWQMVAVELWLEQFIDAGGAAAITTAPHRALR